MTYETQSAAETETLGAKLAEKLRGGEVIAYTGDLGAGKTCFTGGVAAGLGDAGPVTSPTFQIMCVHDAGRMPLFHFDLYRLESADQLEDVGVFEALEDDGACLIEWAEMFAEELGDEHLEVRITREPVGADAAEPARVVELSAAGERAVQLAHAFERSALSL